MIALSRRRFLIGTGASLLAAPSIVRASEIMPVKAARQLTHEEILALLRDHYNRAFRRMCEDMARDLYSDSGMKPSGGLAELLA